jgi:hypothetical protein
MYRKIYASSIRPSAPGNCKTPVIRFPWPFAVKSAAAATGECTGKWRRAPASFRFRGIQRLRQLAPSPTTGPVGAAPTTSRRACPEGRKSGEGGGRHPSSMARRTEMDMAGPVEVLLRLVPDRTVLLPPSARARCRRRRGTELRRGEEGLPRRRSSRHRSIRASARTLVPLAAALTWRRRGERRDRADGAGREGRAPLADGAERREGGRKGGGEGRPPRERRRVGGGLAARRPASRRASPPAAALPGRRAPPERSRRGPHRSRGGGGGAMAAATERHADDDNLHRGKRMGASGQPRRRWRRMRSVPGRGTLTEELCSGPHPSAWIRRRGRGRPRACSSSSSAAPALRRGRGHPRADATRSLRREGEDRGRGENDRSMWWMGWDDGWVYFNADRWTLLLVVVGMKESYKGRWMRENGISRGSQCRGRNIPF